ncbi:MAG: group II intron reverse transcriptase/maturase [Pseudomonadota bacterium]
MAIDKTSRNAKSSVGKLQTSLQTKAKTEPAYRFHSLIDKLWRRDILLEAYRRCRANAGAPGVDKETFGQIDQRLNSWLENLGQELQSGAYRPQPLLRVWIPKSNGGQRPLSIPTIKDRVVQMAMVLVISPIFEEDFLPEQYGFRPGRDAKMAIRQVFWHVSQHGRTEVVDADLRDYFNAIPHGQLMFSLRRRIADGRILHMIRCWLMAPVIEEHGGKLSRTTQARKTRRGVPQGGPLSPLLANIYFRRFALAWRQSGVQASLGAYVVNYADDFVICCRPGLASAAKFRMERIMSKIGLEVNADKTHIADLTQERITFLGYDLGRYYGKGGRPFIGTKPSRKAVKSLRKRIHDRTTPQWYPDTPENTVMVINRLLRGWSQYFDQGPVLDTYREISTYVDRRLRHWLVRRTRQRGRGFKAFSQKYLHETLGLYRLPSRRKDLSSAKV